MKRMIRIFAIGFILPFVFMSAACQDSELMRYKNTAVATLEDYERTLAEENFYYDEDWEYIADLLAETKEKINAQDTKEAIDVLVEEARAEIDSINPMKPMWMIYGMQEAFDQGLLNHEDMVQIANCHELDWSGKERSEIENARAGYLPELEMSWSEYLERGIEYRLQYLGTYNNCYAIYMEPLNVDFDIPDDAEDVEVDGVAFVPFGHCFKLWKIADAEESKPMAIAEMKSYVGKLRGEGLYGKEDAQAIRDIQEDTIQKIYSESTDTYKKVISLCEEAKEKMNAMNPGVFFTIDGEKVKFEYHIRLNGAEYAYSPGYNRLKEISKTISGNSHKITFECSGSLTNPKLYSYRVQLYEDLPGERYSRLSFSEDFVVNYGENIWEFDIELSKDPSAEGILVLEFSVCSEDSDFHSVDFWIPMKIV